MQNAVAAGLRVTTAQHDITVDNFTGLGYLLEDPETGAAAYLISGGRNGGNSPSGQNIYPLPQIPAIPIFGLMVGASLRSAGASLVAESGVITGIALPELAGTGAATAAAGTAVAGAAAAAAILMAVLVILILLTAVIQYVDTKYPRTNRRFRHYSPAATAIASSRLLFASPIGTFGAGVYLADALDEESQGIGCPPDLWNVATRFQMKDPTTETIDPRRASGWIEITITRENYYVIDSKVNSYGQTEYILRAPLFPAIHWWTKTLEPALWIGEYQFGLQFNYLSDVCQSLILLP